MSAEKDLTGRRVLITGAAQRVGRAIALELAAHGAHLIIHYRRSHAAAAETLGACRAAGGRAQLVQADLAKPTDVERLAADARAAFGGVDALVNNASEFEPMALESFDRAAWERCLQVNLTAPLQLVHALAPDLRAGRGHVINLCDVATARPWPEHLAYITSKGALETLTKALARALAPEVCVVGIAPGVAAWPDEYDSARRARLTKRIPLGRAGQPADIAALASFLLRRGGYITGTILAVDGGRSVV